MRILSHAEPDFAAALASLDRHHEPLDHVRTAVADILADVRNKGDEAVLRLTARFEGFHAPSVTALRVTDAEFTAARAEVEPPTMEALRAAHANVLAFAQRGLRQDWSMTNAQGVEVGERHRPIERVGIYVPGGSAPLVSTALMTVPLAVAAGCREIVVATPPGKDGQIAPALLAALELAGATEVWKIGGAQAIAALAYGTPTVRPVLKIAGPGSAWVVEAKRQLAGRVAIDLLPGPSEVLVLASEGARPALVAADLLAQAEHGGDSAMVFVTDSPALLEAVRAEITRQAATLSRRAQLTAVLEKNAVLILARDLFQAAVIANAYAPEHLSLQGAAAESLSESIVSAGAIFLGPWSPVAAGDFLAGPSHTLPTGGAAKFSGGLEAAMFQRRTSWVRADEASLRASLPHIEEFSRVEGLDAHGASARIRFELGPS